MNETDLKIGQNVYADLNGVLVKAYIIRIIIEEDESATIMSSKMQQRYIYDLKLDLPAYIKIDKNFYNGLTRDKIFMKPESILTITKNHLCNIT